MIIAEIVNSTKIRLFTEIDTSVKILYKLLSEPHQIQLWFADMVEKSPSGFKFQIRLPLHTIQSEAKLIQTKTDELVEFVWKSEYSAGNNLVTWRITQNPLGIEIVEIGNYNESRWKKAQEIHLDIWKQAISRLIEYTRNQSDKL